MSAILEFALSVIDSLFMQNKTPDEILTILSSDARVSPETIAKMVGRTVEEVRASIDDFERQGIIKRYITIVDWEKAGIDYVVAFVDVKVVPERDLGFDAVAERIARYPQVRSVWLVSGGSDLRVVVEAQNLRELATFVAEKLATINGVTGTTTHFVLRRYKEDNALFLDVDEDQRLIVSP